MLIREARFVWGLSAPTATLGGQIHAESGYQPTVCNRSGACGLGQFMPATARGLARLYSDLRPAQPTNPTWAIRALVRYDRYIWERVKKYDNPCQRMRLTLAGYNAGPARMYKRWPAETRTYVHRILQVLEPLYVANGWGLGSCNGDGRA